MEFWRRGLGVTRLMADRDLGAIGVCIAAMTSVACGGQAWLQEEGHAEAWNGLGAHKSRAGRVTRQLFGSSTPNLLLSSSHSLHPNFHPASR